MVGFVKAILGATLLRSASKHPLSTKRFWASVYSKDDWFDNVKSCTIEKKRAMPG